MPGPHLAADAAEIVDVVQQRVDQRAARVAGGRVHDHPGRLVDDDEVGVLVEDRRAAASSGRGRRGDRLGHVDDDALARPCTGWFGLAPRGRRRCTWPSLISRWICDRE